MKKTAKRNENILEININLVDERKIEANEKLKSRERIIKMIASFFGAVMGIVVSVVSCNVNNRSREIYEKQLEIITNDREPYFTIICNPINIENEKDDNYSRKKLYTITNKGGLITGAFLSEIFTKAIIKIPHRKNGELSTFEIYFIGLFEKTEDTIFLYDEKTKQFTFYGYENDKFDKFIKDLEVRLRETYPGSGAEWAYSVSVYLENNITINYINYKNEKYAQEYQFWDSNKMTIISDSSYYQAWRLGMLNVNALSEDTIDYICAKIDAIEKNDRTQNGFSLLGVNIAPGRDGALSMAKRYLAFMPYSYNSLLSTLELLEHYSHEEAVYAVDNCGADWNVQAVRSARDYLLFEAYSYEQLLETLVVVEGFNLEQAVYGVDNCDVDWNEQAKRKAQKLTALSEINSRDELIEQLEDEGFSPEQALYGVEQIK